MSLPAPATSQALNLILLTAGEVRELRDALRDAPSSAAGRTNFLALYSCWSHSAGACAARSCRACCACFARCSLPGCHARAQRPLSQCATPATRPPAAAGALLSLCLLAQLYEHSCELISRLSVLPLGAEVLVQLDRLVQLLETPAYAALRLQLLAPSRQPDLLRALYGLLMLLPQSSAFRTLSSRLAAVPAATLMQLEALQGGGGKGGGKQAGQQQQAQWADFDALLTSFVARQSAHAADEERRRLLLEGLRVEEEIAAEAARQAAVAAAEQQQLQQGATPGTPSAGDGG